MYISLPIRNITVFHAYLRISCVFGFGHFLRSGIKSESIFFYKVLYISCSKNFVWNVSSKKMTFQKMNFQLNLR